MRPLLIFGCLHTHIWAIKIKWVERAHKRCRYLIERLHTKLLLDRGPCAFTLIESLIQVQRLPLCPTDRPIEPRSP